jgi:uncharacterized protein (PEP-CTERM system associated)
MLEYSHYRCKRLSQIACVSTFFVCLLPLHANAVVWKVTPSLNLKETYSDNVGLSNAGGDSDFITQISPSLSVTGTGAHLRLYGSYTMQNMFYANNGSRNRISNQLNANTNAELLEDLFFVDGIASISQQNISAFGAQTTDNVNYNSNRTDVITYSISPYIRYKFGSFASTEARYTHNSVSTGVAGFSDSQVDSATISLTSGSRFRSVGWGLSLNQQHRDYGNGNSMRPVDTETFSGHLSYAVTPELRLIATGGYENNNYLSLNGKNPAGAFWTTGFSWNPTKRTSISANIGKRFFGDTYSITASHHTRGTVWNLGYNEDVTTTQSQFLAPATIDTTAYYDKYFSSTIHDPIIRQQYVAALIKFIGAPSSFAEPVNYLTNSYFLQKRLQASVTIIGVRNTLVLSVFDSRRQAQTGQTLDSLFGSSNPTLNDNNTEQVGVSTFWSWKISPHTNANFSAGYTRSTSHPSNIKSDNTNLRISLNKQFQPRLSGMFEVRHNEQSSSQIGSGYGENAVAASLNMTF